ncbi:hypothetical protein HYY75_07600 [bacterium]|nr:hypothetical protein [bacterium]
MTFRFQRSGMAIVIVLSFVLALLTLGSAYIKTFSNIKQTNPKIPGITRTFR